MNWVDAVIAAMVLLGAWSGYRKGFLMTFSQVVSYILGFVGALTFYKSFAEYLGKMASLKAGVLNKVAEAVQLPETVQKAPIQALAMDKVQGALDSMTLPAMYKHQVGELVKELGVITQRADVFTISDAVHQLITGVILQIIAFIILVFVIQIIIKLIFKGIAKLMSYTPAGVLDKGAGLVLGSAKSILVITIMLVAVNPILSLGSLNKAGMFGQICSGIQDSQFSNYLISIIQGMHIFG